MKSLCLATVASVLLAASPAMAADDGDDFVFKLINQTKTGAVSMKTLTRKGTMSGNWLSSPLAKGTSRVMHFNDREDTRCEIRTVVLFDDGTSWDDKVDYCGKSDLVMTEDNFFTR